MKNYVKVVEAVQFLGDIKVLKGILNKQDVIQDENGIYIYKQSGFSEAGYWRLKEGDYVIKENGNITVYKKERFEADFDEVLIEDELIVHSTGIIPDVEKVQVMDLKNTKDVKEIKVKEFIEVKSDKKSVNKDKKE